jgi:pimeloyl-ACP methyl ester carboxylesterase
MNLEKPTMKLHEAGLASGRPLLLLNPFPLHRGVWADNVATWIGGGYRVLTTDYPGLEGPGAGGTGAGDGEAAAPADRAMSPISMSPISMDGLADAVVAELDARGIAQVAVLGVSMGGYVALSLAARFPARLAGLLLADTRAAGDSPAARAGRAAALATLQHPAAGAPEAETRAAVETYLGSSLPKLLAATAPPQMHARVRALAIRRRASLIAGIVALLDRPDRSAALPTLQVPTLVVCGSDDQIVPAAEMQEMARAIPCARFEAIPGAGHLPNLEQPARFEQLVGAFLEELVGATA